MGSKKHDDSVHILLFPFMAHGHMIPISDMAKIFASHNVNITIVTTPINAVKFRRTTQQSTKLNVQIKAIEFPSEQVGIPKGCENVDTLPSPDLLIPFYKALRLLRPQFEELLDELRPSCVVADMMFPWATEAAAKFGIPRLVFHGTSFFAMCAVECVKLYEPYNTVSSETEPFVIPHFPGEIELTGAQLPNFVKYDEVNDFTELLKEIREVELKSFGVVMNSFYELEPVYADFYRNELGGRAWHLGPVSLCNKDNTEKIQRGKEATIDEHECLKWLDAKKPDSVVYVSFGSVADFDTTQLTEIALALEAAGHEFIWVVRKGEDDAEEWLPEGFEERMEGKGLIIRGWAPQVLILDHSSVGGFVTHCGWNSTLESISAGVPMVTWPIAAEQFYNEKLVTGVLKIGVGVGARKWVRLYGDSVKKEAIVNGLRRIMEGEEAAEMRSRAKKLGMQARRAVEEGGSSYQSFDKLIEELRSQNQV